MKRDDKKAQITIYIIIAVVIVAVVILFLVLRAGIIPNPLSSSEIKDANSYLEECVEEEVSDALGILGPRGGTIEPVLYKNFKFTDETKAYKISYLCYNADDKAQCVIQYPNLQGHVESEIKNYVEGTVDSCLSDLNKSYERAGYQTKISGEGYEVKLSENKVSINFNQKIELTKSDQSTIRSNLAAEIPTRIYSLMNTAQEIVNDETSKCSFDAASFSMNHPEKEIDTFRTEDKTLIYTVTLRDSGEFFRFALKGGCRGFTL